MSHNQRLGAVGIGVEATPGTSVTPTNWLQVSSAPALNDVVEYENIETARGRVEKSQGQKAMKKFAEGSIEVLADAENALIPFGVILGSTASASATATLYDHTITLDNSNTAKASTVVIDRVEDIRKFSNAVVSELTISVSDSFATLTIAFQSKASATGSASDTYDDVVCMTFENLEAQFGTTVANAGNASVTPLSGLDLTITRDVEKIFQSGDVEPNDFVYKTLGVSGNYSLLFDGTDNRDKYLDDTQNAAIFTFTDADDKYIKITIPNLRLSNWTPSNDLDEVVTQTADFTGHYDSTQTEGIRVVVRNATETVTNL